MAKFADLPGLNSVCYFVRVPRAHGIFSRGRFRVSQNSGGEGERLSAHRRVGPQVFAGEYECVSVLHRGRNRETGEVAESGVATSFRRNDDIN